MTIRYISGLVSRRLADSIAHVTSRDPGFAVQKFSRLLVKGLLDNGMDVTVFSVPPVNSHYPKLIWHKKDEVEDGILFKYYGFINIPIFRHIGVFLSAFFSVLNWGAKKKEDKVIICDILNISLCLGAVWAARIIGTKAVGVMTDMPGMMVNLNGHRKGIKSRIVTRINKSYLSSFTHYVFLTEAMNDIVNKNNRPYIVMEGMSDLRMIKMKKRMSDTVFKSILYAGSLHERYGLKTLVNAFHSISQPDAMLIIYGTGPYVDEIKHMSKIDGRIVYMGIAPNEEIIDAEIRASLLVNPRPTTEDFTMFSFPSKNIEYMASGTPLLTTALPGMPKEYHQYVYLIEDESEDGFKRAIESTLNMPPEDLFLQGQKARRFVLETKNNTMQAARIVELIKR